MRMKVMLTLLLAFCLAPASQADLVGHWAFEEGAGDVAADLSANGIDGTVTGAIWTDGYLGGGLSFDGVDDKIEFGTAPSVDGYGDFTVSAWINTSAGGAEQAIFQQRNGGYNGQWQLRLNSDGRLHLWTYRNGWGIGATSTNPVNDGQWHHVAAVRNRATGQIYVDGELVGEHTHVEIQWMDPAIACGIGLDIRDNNRPFNGIVDEVYFYDHALTAEEVAANMTPFSPADREAGIPLDAELRWCSPAEFEAVYYDVIFDGVRVLPQTTDVTYAPLLAPSTTYTWRVDAYEPNDLPGGQPSAVTGTEISFTTRGPEPIFVEQPQSTAAKVGDVVEFSVVAEQADTLTWFASVDPNNNSFGDDTEIGTGSAVDVEIADVLNFYCKASGVGDTYSDVASVRLKRLAGWYKLDGNADDSGPNGNHGALTNLVNLLPVDPAEEPTWTDGIHGQCLRVSTSGTYYVEVAPENAEDYTFEERFSASVWVKSNSTPKGYGVLVGMVLDSPSRPWMIRQSGTNDQIQFKTHDDFTAMGNSAAFDNEWHLVTGTWDKDTGERKLYVDGTLVDTQTGFTGLSNVRAEGAEVPLRIGYYKDDYTFSDALFDDVRLYDYALDPVEVAELYFEGTGKYACVENPELDSDGDCVVGLGDLALIAAEWMNCNLLPTTLCD